MSAAQESLSSRPREARAGGEVQRLAAVFLRLLGRRGVAAVAGAVLGSMSLAVADLVIALLLQLFLQQIGVFTQPVTLPGPLKGLRPSGSELALAVVAIGLVRSAGQYAVSLGGVTAFERTNAQLRHLAIYEMLLEPAHGFVPAALIHARISETFQKAAWACFFGVPFVAALAQGVVLAAAMGIAAWRESLVAFAGIAIVGVTVLAVNRRTRGISAQMPKEQLVLTQGIERVARNVLLIRVLRTEAEEHRRLNESIETYERFSLRGHGLTAIAGTLTPFFAIVLLLVIVVASRQVLGTGGLALLTFFYLFLRFAQNLSSVVQLFAQVNLYFPQFHDSLTYAARFDKAGVRGALEDARRAAADRGARTARDHVDASDPLGPSLAISHASYGYPGAVRDALSDVSATIPAGSQFAVVGPSGSGKSTLLALLVGLMRPTRGSVAIDGRAPEDYFRDPEVRVGYVGAEPFLIAGSVRENICYGLARTIDDSEIQLALERAHLRAVVDALPGGLAYAIAEDGSGLSAGQKQRLCLARALLNRPHVLVLDEVSANLDAATEAEIAESLRALRGRCTTILVSHRSAVLKYADQVLDLTPPGDSS